MAFDYCTASEAFAYGGSAGNGTDPINEAAVMAEVVTAASRAIDRYCHQSFSTETYTDQRLRARIDQDGVLTCYPPVPTLTTPTAAAYRVGNALTWTALDLSSIDIETHPHGSVVRFLTPNLVAYRTQRSYVQLSYTGGYANRAALPDDLAWAARAVAWYEYQRRSAPLDQTAMPSMGIVVIPGDWPRHITSKLTDYVKVTPT